MKALALVLAASATLSSSAFAKVLGVQIKDGYSISYDRVYESDSGYADINDCTTTVRNAKGKILAQASVFLTTTPGFCGEIHRNGTAVYSYSTESDGGYREEFCFRSELSHLGWSSPELVDTSLCGR